MRILHITAALAAAFTLIATTTHAAINPISGGENVQQVANVAQYGGSMFKTWACESTIQDITAILTVLIMGIGACAALLRWRTANRTKHAEFYLTIIDRLFNDPAMREAMYMVDYDKEWYGEHFKGEYKKNEKIIDGLLALLTYVCYLNDRNVIEEEEFTIVRYALMRVCRSRQTREYLWNLYHFSKRQNTVNSDRQKTVSSFHYLIEYMKKNIFNDTERRNFECFDANSEYTYHLERDPSKNGNKLQNS